MRNKFYAMTLLTLTANNNYLCAHKTIKLKRTYNCFIVNFNLPLPINYFDTHTFFRTIYKETHSRNSFKLA